MSENEINEHEMRPEPVMEQDVEVKQRSKREVKESSPVGGVPYRTKLTVLHRAMVLSRATHKHHQELTDNAANRTAIIEGGKAKGYPVSFADYPNRDEVVAWLG